MLTAVAPHTAHGIGPDYPSSIANPYRLLSAPEENGLELETLKPDLSPIHGEGGLNK